MEEVKRVKRKWVRETEWEYPPEGDPRVIEYRYAIATCPFCGYTCDAERDCYDPDYCPHCYKIEGEEVIFIKNEETEEEMKEFIPY